MILFPEGTLRRTIFEWIDREFAFLMFDSALTISAYCGKQIAANREGGLKPCLRCRFCCWVASWFENDHCFKNKDRP